MDDGQQLLESTLVALSPLAEQMGHRIETRVLLGRNWCLLWHDGCDLSYLLSRTGSDQCFSSGTGTRNRAKEIARFPDLPFDIANAGSKNVQRLVCQISEAKTFRAFIYNKSEWVQREVLIRMVFSGTRLAGVANRLGADER